MPKGFFSQGVAVLCARPVGLDDLEPVLRAFRIVKRNDGSPSSHLGGPSLVVAFRPEVNGYVQIDLQDHAWPDHMGDPKGEPDLFAAWTMGHFGPFTFPGNLQRAGEQSWHWREARMRAQQHRACIRVRSSYILGASRDAPVLPADYEPLGELEFVTKVARALLDHPAGLAHFNPGGEMLMSRELMDEQLNEAANGGPPPLPIWSNVRLFNPGNGWLLMDSIGMEQLDRPDSEACFPEDQYEPGEVAGFLRNCGLYLMEKGEVIEDGDTMDGPGEVRWQALHVDEPLVPAPRRSLRWFPLDGTRAPDEMLRGVRR